MHIQKLSLSNWPLYVKANLFAQSDGFNEIPYFSNSGELMKKSMIALNPTEHNCNEQSISCDNEVLRASMLCREVMKGLWIFATEIDVRQNIICKTLYDETEDCDFYFLSFAVFKYYYPIDTIQQSFVTLSSITNTFYKPKTKVTNYFYEGSKGLFINIAFTKDWVLENLRFSDIVQSKTDVFFNQRQGLINWMEVLPDTVAMVENVYKIVYEGRSKDSVTEAVLPILSETISEFFNVAMLDSRIDNSSAFLDNDYAKLSKAEQIILTNLNKPFVGVNQIADIVEMSATKLKSSFKAVYGYSMLQYHKEKNMRLAYQILQTGTVQIKYVTELVGFASVSKFSAAFKKRFGMLPSAVRKQLP
jgi:AraC-like DNA-binding protein